MLLGPSEKVSPAVAHAARTDPDKRGTAAAQTPLLQRPRIDAEQFGRAGLVEEQIGVSCVLMDR
jgi:hypothetical protein